MALTKLVLKGVTGRVLAVKGENVGEEYKNKGEILCNFLSLTLYCEEKWTETKNKPITKC